jgi:hypothetical protein
MKGESTGNGTSTDKQGLSTLTTFLSSLLLDFGITEDIPTFASIYFGFANSICYA